MTFLFSPYRCTIIRGKTQSEMEDLLPFYAQTVHKICPCNKSEFDQKCNNRLSLFFFKHQCYEDLPDSNKKTIRNHITEIMGKLLGLYYKAQDGDIYEADSCKHLNKYNDFPLFFKNICIHLQFPNASQKIKTISESISNRLKIRPLCFVVSLLYYAESQKENLLLTKQEIGYYALNNLYVLQGKVSEKEVYEQIIKDRKENIKHDKLKGSHDWQHINEMFNLLNLSNVTISDSVYIWLNKDEMSAILEFISYQKKSLFDMYKYKIEKREEQEQMNEDWGKYYGSIAPEIELMETQFRYSSDTVVLSNDHPTKERGCVGLTTVELGDKGEALVFKMEKERVRKYKERLVNKVLLLGKTKGLGYDISSIEAEMNLKFPEFARYIEVKSTKRVTTPSLDENWSDSVNLTSKEWIAAAQYKEYYNIYRVYFTREKIIIVIINNPYQKLQDNIIDVYPTIYQMDFNSKAITYVQEEKA